MRCGDYLTAGKESRHYVLEYNNASGSTLYRIVLCSIACLRDELDSGPLRGMR